MTRTTVVLTAVPAVALVLLGATLIAAGVAQSREGGFTGVGPAAVSTPARALVTREVEVGARSGRPADPGLDLGELAEVRIRTTSGNADAPLFVGIGPTEDVERYLAGVEHDEMASYTTDPLVVSYHRTQGTQVPTDPSAQDFWVASSAGTGSLDLRWAKTSGTWSVVAMNLDGSPGVAVTADVGLRFGFLLPLGAGLLAVGLAAFAALVVRSRSRR